MRINLFTKFDQIRTQVAEWGGIHLVQGVYFLCDGPTLLYIGSSGNIMERIASHYRYRIFSRVFYLNLNRLKIEEIREIELLLIQYFRPPLNKHTPAGSTVSYQWMYEVLILEYLEAITERGSGPESFHPDRRKILNGYYSQVS